MKQRLAEHKQKRQIESKLSQVTPLGESDEEDGSAQAWVVRSRKIQHERAQAEKQVITVLKLFHFFIKPRNPGCIILKLLVRVNIKSVYHQACENGSSVGSELRSRVNIIRVSYCWVPGSCLSMETSYSECGFLWGFPPLSKKMP